MFHFLRVMAVQRFVRFVSKTITNEDDDDNGHRRHYVYLENSCCSLVDSNVEKLVEKKITTKEKRCKDKSKIG